MTIPYNMLNKMFMVAHKMAPFIEVELKKVSPEDGGMTDYEWQKMSGGTLLVRDSELRIVRSEMIMSPTYEWFTESHGHAGRNASVAIKREAPSCRYKSDEHMIYAGGIPSSYEDKGEVCNLGWAFCGGPQQWVNHAAVVVWLHVSECISDGARTEYLRMVKYPAILDAVLAGEQACWACGVAN